MLQSISVTAVAVVTRCTAVVAVVITAAAAAAAVVVVPVRVVLVEGMSGPEHPVATVRAAGTGDRRRSAGPSRGCAQTPCRNRRKCETGHLFCGHPRRRGS